MPDRKEGTRISRICRPWSDIEGGGEGTDRRIPLMVREEDTLETAGVEEGMGLGIDRGIMVVLARGDTRVIELIHMLVV